MTDYIDVYVSPGQNSNSSLPFYTFYLEDSDTSQTITTLNTNAKYRFHRLNGASSHPFYISDTAAYSVPSNKIMIQGDGSPTVGITSNENFTLEFTGGSSGLPTSLYFFCTVSSHAMVGDFFELDLGKHTWVDNYYVINKHSSINKVKGNLVSGKNLYIQNNIDIKNTTNLTVQGNSKLIIASVDSSEYTALTDGSSSTAGSIDWAVSQYFSSGGVASFLPGGANESYGPIELWNTGSVGSMISLFDGETDFNKNISAWDVSSVTGMYSMFDDCSKFNQPLGEWDMSNVKSVRQMFRGCSKFNQPIGTWNVSNVGTTDNLSGANDFYSGWGFRDMFRNASAFNHCIADWERTVGEPLPTNPMINATSTSTVNKCKNMQSMFEYATNYNQPMDNWDISAVTKMDLMFYGASSLSTTGENKFNQYLGSWGYKFNTGTVSLFSMFQNCEITSGTDIPNTPVTTQATWTGYQWPDNTLPSIPLTQDSNSSPSEGGIHWAVSQIGTSGSDTSKFDKGGEYYKYGTVPTWNVINITSMRFLFFNKSNFNSDLSLWNVNNVKDMSYIFRNASSFNKDLSNWNVSNVTNMAAAFLDADSFNNNNVGGTGSGLDKWDVSNVQNMGSMFSGSSFNQEINSWNVSLVTSMSSMFYDTPFNKNISDWERDGTTGVPGISTVGNCKNMRSMFSNATQFNQDIAYWNVTSVTNMETMFANTSSFEQNLINWQLNSINEPSSNPTFYTQGMFINSKALTAFPNLIASPVKSNWATYWPPIPLTDGNSSTPGSIKWAVSQWFNNSSQFSPWIAAQSSPGVYAIYGTIDKWDTSNVTNMSSLFSGKSSFNQDITAWDVSKVTDFRNMFSGAKAFDQDIGVWTINGNGNPINMSSMFNTYQPTSNLSNLNIGNWERTGSTMANVTSMRSMFTDNGKFNKPIGNWNISGCTDFYGMFYNAFGFYQDLSAWVTTGGGFHPGQSTGLFYSFKNFLNQASNSQYDRNGKAPGEFGYDANLLTLQTKTLGDGNFTSTGTDAGNGIPTLNTNDPQNTPGQPDATAWQAYDWP